MQIFEVRREVFIANFRFGGSFGEEEKADIKECVDQHFEELKWLKERTTENGLRMLYIQQKQQQQQLRINNKLNSDGK